MALYRGKYILEGLEEIKPNMRHNLDIAYNLCASYEYEFHCKMCGRCCYQPHIIIRPEEIDRISSYARIPLFKFISEYITQTCDGRLLLKKISPCAFLDPDNKCSIWDKRPEICSDFPYTVSMFVSRVYLALINPDLDIMKLIEYMDDTWPCTKVIKNSIKQKIEHARSSIL